MAIPILILSGPVGAGKTTVAREMVSQLGDDVVLIDGDVWWSFFVKNGARGPTPKTFRTIMSSMTAAAIPFATGGSRVILDFSIPPWFLDTVRKIAGMRDVPLDYVVLRPSVQACAERAKARSEGSILDYSQYRELYRDFDEVARHIVCDDAMSAGEAAAVILRKASQGEFRL
ncbi:MAG TPA: AAA family ATPase [Gemmatimonadaceae bacterium]